MAPMRAECYLFDSIIPWHIKRQSPKTHRIMLPAPPPPHPPGSNTPSGHTPSPALTLVHRVETHAFRAWPAPEVQVQGDWLLRGAGGFTKRANSANAAVPQAGFGGVQAAAEAFYARRALPAVFRLTPLAGPEADAALAAAGYEAFDPSRVMARPLPKSPPPCPPGVDVTDRPGAGWLEGFARANGVDGRHHRMHHAMVRAIAAPAGFATLREAGVAIGFGLAVCEDGLTGFYDIVISPAHRRRGHGRTLMQGLLAWARDQGATEAYLQVRDGNAGARQLYAGLGFADLYRYHYRVPQPGRIAIV